MRVANHDQACNNCTNESNSSARGTLVASAMRAQASCLPSTIPVLASCLYRRVSHRAQHSWPGDIRSNRPDSMHMCHMHLMKELVGGFV
jgi:hypothetical protein